MADIIKQSDLPQFVTVEHWGPGDYNTEATIGASATVSTTVDMRRMSKQAVLLVELATVTDVDIVYLPSDDGSNILAESDKNGTPLTLASTLSSATGNGKFAIDLSDMVWAPYVQIRFVNQNAIAGTVKAVIYARGGE